MSKLSIFCYALSLGTILIGEVIPEQYEVRIKKIAYIIFIFITFTLLYPLEASLASLPYIASFGFFILAIMKNVKETESFSEIYINVGYYLCVIFMLSANNFFDLLVPMILLKTLVIIREPRDIVFNSEYNSIYQYLVFMLLVCLFIPFFLIQNYFTQTTELHSMHYLFFGTLILVIEALFVGSKEQSQESLGLQLSKNLILYTLLVLLKLNFSSLDFDYKTLFSSIVACSTLYFLVMRSFRGINSRMDRIYFLGRMAIFVIYIISDNYTGNTLFLHLLLFSILYHLAQKFSFSDVIIAKKFSFPLFLSLYLYPLVSNIMWRRIRYPYDSS